ncbi:M16 family metallopeptidase [Streptomyces sp. NPDC004111]|uniref:M16 family metallopeptidase n=1 Tax=Streptomyces sp. NPDC004111 TaxID=3364690 RepID=UPI0036BFFFCC
MTGSLLSRRFPQGLRLSTEPLRDGGRGLVSVALAVAAGSDDDPAGLHGTAHLVEHLMFPRAAEAAGTTGTAGTANTVGTVGTGESHAARIAGVGGVCNAETHRDHTVFHTTVPAEMLPEVLAWEARRLLTFDPPATVLRTETGVIAEEIRGAPATGRLWDTALAALYPGSRDSYGTPAELAGATAADARAFFRRHYRADRTALSVVGDVDPAEVSALVGELFAELPQAEPECAGSTAARTSATTAPLLAPASATTASLPTPASATTAPLPAPVRPAAGTVVRTPPVPATVAAVAVGHALPDPRADRPGYLAQVLLAEVLGRGRAARALRADPRLTAARVSCGLYGQWLGSAAPDLTLVLLRRAAGASPDDAVQAWLDALAEVAEHGVPREEHRRALNALLVACHRGADSLTARAVGHARTALLFPGSGGTDALPGELRALAPQDLVRAARALLAGPRSQTELGGTPR